MGAFNFYYRSFVPPNAFGGTQDDKNMAQAINKTPRLASQRGFYDEKALYPDLSPAHKILAVEKGANPLPRGTQRERAG